MSKTKGAAAILQWEIEEARYLRQHRRTWREIAELLDRDMSGIRRATVRNRTEINASGGETETVGV